jgi:hypothetical protein
MRQTRIALLAATRSRLIDAAVVYVEKMYFKINFEGLRKRKHKMGQSSWRSVSRSNFLYVVNIFADFT